MPHQMFQFKSILMSLGFRKPESGSIYHLNGLSAPKKLKQGPGETILMPPGTHLPAGNRQRGQEDDHHLTSALWSSASASSWRNLINIQNLSHKRVWEWSSQRFILCRIRRYTSRRVDCRLCEYLPQEAQRSFDTSHTSGTVRARKARMPPGLLPFASL